jgi:AcrR family transcriptional regulator
MVRQARSEATRQKIIAAAVELFSETGYADAGLGDIIEGAELTKGALYYHFDSKDALAAAVIEEGGAAVLRAFEGGGESPAPALENMIHCVFDAAELMADNKVARTAIQLVRAVCEFNQAASRMFGAWLRAMTAHARQASAEGDLRPSLDPNSVGETIIAAVFGAELMSSAISDGDNLTQRLTKAWQLLLPAITNDDSLPYFREFLTRESLRRFKPTLSIE